jgi:resuscitation-promoting factor RpfA
VATCEEGGRNDPSYGYFGIMVGSWLAYGGGAYASTAGGATWDEQVIVATRIDGGYVPDANGCASW